MTIRANRDPKFYFRFLLIGVALIGVAFWFLYDGAVKYPKQFPRAEKYHELQEAGRLDEWPALASKNGWPTDVPKTEVDSQVQFIFAGMFVLFGLLCLFVVWRSRGRWIEGTESGITSSWGQSLDFANVVSLDKKQWRKKGIAKVSYQDGKRRRRFVIDDYKFDREPTGQILRELESQLTDDQITGGPPEGAEDDLGEPALTD